MAEDRKNLVVLTGPTAVGKSALSVRLAKDIGGEIISADCMQVYRGMDIGSAKIRPEEMNGVPHYLIDVLDPEERFDVVTFQRMAKDAMEEVRRHGHIPILVGGTGFYIQSVVYDIDFTAHGEDDTYRRRLEQLAQTEGGPEKLHRMLQQADPASAEQIHPNNIKRTIRALEFHRQTGDLMSRHNEEQRARTSPWRFVYFVLNDDRAAVYERIDRRVDLMMEEGLEEEVRRLRDRGLTRDMVSMQGLGYRQMLDYLDGRLTKEEAVRIIKRDTRHFAKRQITWFKRERDVTWIDRGTYGQDEEKILSAMEEILREKGILKEREEN